MSLIEELLCEDISKGSHTFSHSRNSNILTWDVHKLWKLVENEKVYEIPVSTFKKLINSKSLSYNDDDWERVYDSDLNYPVILSGTPRLNNPYVLDGIHRIMKAHRSNRVKIKVQFLPILPPPDIMIGKPFTINGIAYMYKNKIY